jgi:hypothetical protein
MSSGAPSAVRKENRLLYNIVVHTNTVLYRTSAAGSLEWEVGYCIVLAGEKDGNEARDILGKVLYGRLAGMERLERNGSWGLRMARHLVPHYSSTRLVWFVTP